MKKISLFFLIGFFITLDTFCMVGRWCPINDKNIVMHAKVLCALKQKTDEFGAKEGFADTIRNISAFIRRWQNTYNI